MKKEISLESTKEEIVDYFFKSKFEKTKLNFLKEDISGEVLPDLKDEDFNYLEVKLGPLAKIKKYLLENKERFKPKEIQEKITYKANSEKVKVFLKNVLILKEI